MNIHLMTHNAIKPLREKLWLRNNKCCPILSIPIPLENTTLDHIHKRKSEPISPNGGVIRDTLDFRSNAMEGKITNAYKRYFGANTSKHPIPLPTFLRNLADYLEAGAYVEDNTIYAHPSEVPKRQRISKKELNNIHKWYKVIYPKRKKLPTWTYINTEYLSLLKLARELNDKYKTTKKYYKEQQ